MPTSKDILNEAKKCLEQNKIAVTACEDMVKSGVTDTAAFAKARAELATSINSMKRSVELDTDRLKELNAGLSELQKAAPVMKAPADAKVYADLVKDLKAEVQKGMTWTKKMSDTLSKAQSIFK